VLELRQIIEIAPSILSADFAHLAREIRKAEKGGANLIHLDVMDGHFVPNITIGPPVVASILKITSLPLNAHLMIENPERYLEEFIDAGVNGLSVHVEADVHLDRTLQFLRDKKINAGVAINPGTSLSVLDEVLPLADFVLVMTVNPGFGGQKFIPTTLKKIRRLREIIVSNGYKTRIEVDGGIGADNLMEVFEAGAEIIVMGSAIFSSKNGPSVEIRRMKRIGERYVKSLVAE
jgi:ribulose-phosphate 3-epimerase